jgi:hypothetical protein
MAVDLIRGNRKPATDQLDGGVNPALQPRRVIRILGECPKYEKGQGDETGPTDD